MVYEIQKAVMIPVFAGYFRQEEGESPTAELWQTVDRTSMAIGEAKTKLKKFREWNKDKNLHYRLIEIVEET